MLLLIFSLIVVAASHPTRTTLKQNGDLSAIECQYNGKYRVSGISVADQMHIRSLVNDMKNIIGERNNLSPEQLDKVDQLLMLFYTNFVRGWNTAVEKERKQKFLDRHSLHYNSVLYRKEDNVQSEESTEEIIKSEISTEAPQAGANSEVAEEETTKTRDDLLYSAVKNQIILDAPNVRESTADAMVKIFRDHLSVTRAKLYDIVNSTDVPLYLQYSKTS